MRMPGTWVVKRWWDQEVIDLAGFRVAEASAEDEGGTEDPEGGSEE